MLGLLAILCLSALPTQAAEPLPSVVSTDLCADLILLNVADPGQILSLSRQSQDPRVSPVAEAAHAYPANRGSVEDLLYLKPDIALVYLGWTARRHADLLASQGTRVIALPYPRNWSDALETTRRIAVQIGRGEVGKIKTAEAERRMRALADRTRPDRLLYLRPSGGTAGKGTYVDDLITRLGLRNLAAEQGQTGWGRFPLERLVRSPPDLFLLGYFDQARSPADSAYGRHPLLRAILDATPSISVPTGTWGCGGLELVDAAEQIVTQLDRLGRARPGQD
ncbi:ABC transporter substrate-binding protein [Thiocystis violascens]|uniref:ABC transporter substrate-binding protein n=1 Tax=Thiocystis violascens TaxID=73141 RepID=UPI000A075A0A|nr:ABC transporter substrate-binding protein [Thiocystis violascens]